jgi:uroporphyrinogen-III synthase
MTRVAITTAADGYPRLAQIAQFSGLDPVPLPCIQVMAARAEILDMGKELAARADWLVLTSARVVDILWPDGGMPATSVAAAGRATASAVERAGGRPALVGESGGEALAAELVEKIGGLSVVFPHAAGTNPATLETLREATEGFEAVPVYETTPVAPGLDPVDAVAFGSPSAVRGWALSRDFDDLVLAAIGESTADVLADTARPPEVMPPRPAYEDLFALLAQHMRQRSPV